MLACDHKAIDTKLYCVAVAADAGGCEGANSGAPAGSGGGTGQRGEGGETLLTRCELPPCTVHATLRNASHIYICIYCACNVHEHCAVRASSHTCCACHTRTCYMNMHT